MSAQSGGFIHQGPHLCQEGNRGDEHHLPTVLGDFRRSAVEEPAEEEQLYRVPQGLDPAETQQISRIQQKNRRDGTITADSAGQDL